MLYYIALEPEKRIYGLVKKAKNWVLTNLGDQKYLHDQPHLTLYVAYADNISLIEQELEKFCKKQEKISGEIINWLEFPNDIINDDYTLALEFSPNTVEILKPLQLDLIRKLNPFRKGRIVERYIKPNFQGVMKENLEKFGYPFAGSIWLPHISFCSFQQPNQIDSFKKKYPLEIFKSPFSFDKISLYRLYSDDKSELIKRFELK